LKKRYKLIIKGAASDLYLTVEADEIRCEDHIIHFYLDSELVKMFAIVNLVELKVENI
jgi:hypothetical protein